MIQVRQLVETEKTPTIVLYFSLTATLLSLISVPFGWNSLSVTQAMLLITSGICGGVAQIFLTESYRHAEVSVIAPSNTAPSSSASRCPTFCSVIFRRRQC